MSIGFIIRIKELFYYFFNRLPRILVGKYISHNLVKIHWGRATNNFGDCMQPLIATHYGLLPVYVSNYQKSNLILEGSILQLVPNDYKGIILGTGGDNLKYKFENAQIFGVRGVLTRDNLTGVNNKRIILGDAGLLMKLVFPKPLHNINKRYKLGIIFHFVDEDTEIAEIYRKNFPSEEVLFINVLDSVKKVIMKINQCDAILSSSLHGLIIADAYGIPNIRIVSRQTMPTPFYDYKFIDYYTSIGIDEKPVEICGDETLNELLSLPTLKPQDRIADLISGLDNAMKNVAHLIIANN